MATHKLFMLLLGCKPKGRHTEQHDIFISIGKNLKDLIPQIHEFWPDGGTIHIDAWREVNCVDDHKVIIKKRTASSTPEDMKLFFINLGGYKPGEFEEYHYKILSTGKNKTTAIQQAKKSAFFKHFGFKGAASHIDDKYGVDVDDLYQIEDMLPSQIKAQFEIHLSPSKRSSADEWHIGYTKLSGIK